MDPIYIGSSMDGGLIYQIAPDEYIKINVTPISNIKLLIDNINQTGNKIVQEKANYIIMKYHVPELLK